MARGTDPHPAGAGRLIRPYDGPVSPDPTVPLLGVFVIACVFLFAGLLLAARRPRGEDPDARALARRYLAGSVACVVVGLLLAAVPVGWLLLTLTGAPAA